MRTWLLLIALAACATDDDLDYDQIDETLLASCAPQRAAGAVPAYHRALLDLIATTEGTRGATANDGYDITFGYHHYASCERHPNIRVCSGSLCSTAAGRYQFLYGTWQGLGYGTFHPDDQDRAAMDLVHDKRGVSVPTTRALTRGEFEAAMGSLSYEWASLPPGRYGQPSVSMARAWELYSGFASHVHASTGNGTAAVIDRDGKYHVFAIDRRGVLNHAYYDGVWHWQALGGTVLGEPGVTYDAATHRFDVFAPSPNGRMYQKTYDGAWGPWHSLGGANLVAGASAVRDRDGAYHVFAIDRAGVLQQAIYSGPSTGWRWQALGGTVTGNPGVVYDPASHRFDVFSTSAGGFLYQKTYQSGWGPWHALPGGSALVSGASAVRDRAGVYHVFAITRAGILHQAIYSGGAWHWQALGGTVAGTPAVAYSAASDRFDVFAPSPAGIMYQKTHTGTWTPWHAIGGSGLRTEDEEMFDEPDEPEAVD